MAYWTVAQIEASRERLAIHCLGLAGYTVYAPRIAVPKRRTTALLFPSYIFVEVVSGWWNARWAAGVVRLLLDGGDRPAAVPDDVITKLRASERGGLVILPKQRGLQRGDNVRIVRGIFVGQLGLFDGQKPHERCAVLLRLLGGLQRVELRRADIAPAGTKALP